MEYWEGKHYAFFQNTACEFFPCHKTGHPEKFSCNEKGIKDCSGCLFPHRPENYGRVTARFSEIAELAKKPPEKESE